MSTLDRAVLAERTMTVERHLRRVAERLPAAAADSQQSTVHAAAKDGPADLLTFSARLSDRLPPLHP